MQKISSTNYKIFVTTNFKKESKNLYKKYPSLKNDLEKLIIVLEKDPFKGIPLGKDCYKIRMAISSKGKGKRGGSRILTCVKIVSTTLYLLSIYDKSSKEGLSDKELDELIKIAGL